MHSELSQRLLVIDDDDLSRDVITLVLAADGFSIEAFDSGEAALAHLTSAASAFDVVLCDLQMPGLSGSSLAAALRPHLPPSVTLIVMSASKPTPAALTGFDAFLPKPFTADDLRALLVSTPAPVLIDLQAAAEPDPTHANPVLDPAVFDELSTLMRPAQMRELLSLCFAEISRHTAAMHRALVRHDVDSFRAAAHALKGGVAMIGARELQTLAAHLEAVAESANQLASLREIPAAAERLRRILGARGIELPSGPVAQGDALA